MLAAGVGAKPPYPESRTVDVVDTLHGVEVPDPYRWLEAGDDPEVQAWTARQNELTRGYLDRFRDVRADLRRQLETLHDTPTIAAPRIAGDRFFLTRREPGENQPAIYLRDGKIDAEPRLLINPNEWADDGTEALDWWYPSPSGHLIAYGRSSGGDEMSTLYLHDVSAAADSALQIPRTRAGAVAWDADGRGFLYVQYPEAGTVPAGDELVTRYVKYHKFGTALADDPIVFGEDRPRAEWHDCYNSSDDGWQFISASRDWSRNDLFFRANAREAGFVPLAVDLPGAFEGDAHDGTLYLRTSFQAERFRIIAVDPEQPSQAGWRTVVPELEGVIEGFVIAGKAPPETAPADPDGARDDPADGDGADGDGADESGDTSEAPAASAPADEPADGGVRLVVQVLENVRSRLLVYGLDGDALGEIELPQALGQVTGLSARAGSPVVYFTFESFAFPPALYAYDLDTGERRLIEQADLEIESDAFVTEQVWCTSRDGTRVPLFVVHRQGLEKNGANPTILYGYGGFEIALKPGFSANIMPWLQAGGVYAVANLRGGGEFGQAWHAAGRLERKQNVFDDMIAAAEHLQSDGYTRADRLGIYGGSNGGLLMGAMLTQRPDLFGAVYCAVPLLDMLRYHKFLIGALWIPEYGSADEAEQFHWLRAYSPYHNVADGTAYPATLITTAEADSRVDPSHARKMAARLQAASSGDDPILLWIETRAGHGAGKPLTKQIDSAVDRLTFFMWRLMDAE